MYDVRSCVCMYCAVRMHVCMYVGRVLICYACMCAFVRMYVCMCVFVRMYLCMYMCVCAHVCIYVCVADTNTTLIDEKTSIPLISEEHLYSHNGTISEYMVSSVLPAYSAETAELPHSSPLESSSQIIYHTESPPRLSSWHRHRL